MSVPQALPAINTILALGDEGSPEAFDAIANIGDLSLNLSAATVDVTSHSTGTPWVRTQSTLLDAGECTLPCYWIPSSTDCPQHAELLAIFKARSVRNYQMWFPDDYDTTYQLRGVITKIAIKAPVTGVVQADITFKWTDEPNFTATKAEG